MTDSNLSPVELLNNYAAFCKDDKYFLASKIALERALNLEPNNSVLWGNIGSVLWNLNEYDAAEQAFLRAIELAEKTSQTFEHIGPYANLGLLYGAKRQWDKALEAANRAIEIEPNLMTPIWDKTMLLLDKGDWEEGLKTYDVRFDCKVKGNKRGYPTMPAPIWDGSDLNGKSIFIQGEQGTGDRILFSRYLPWLRLKYPDVKIIYCDNPQMQNLLWEYHNMVDFVPDGIPFPKTDYSLYIMSLAKFYGTTPNNIPPDPGLIYKRVAPWKQYCNLPQCNLPQTDKPLKVGICWSGNSTQVHNMLREIPFEQIIRLARNPNIILYSLQVGPSSQDIYKYNVQELISDLGPQIEKEGYVGTGQVIMNLDLIISCDTSVAHLAGALNVPTWLLLCYVPYWVWLREGEKTGWYPSMKIFRQSTPGKWEDIINNVEEQLGHFIRGV